MNHRKKNQSGQQKALIRVFSLYCLSLTSKSSAHFYENMYTFCKKCPDILIKIINRLPKNVGTFYINSARLPTILTFRLPFLKLFQKKSRAGKSP